MKKLINCGAALAITILICGCAHAHYTQRMHETLDPKTGAVTSRDVVSSAGASTVFDSNSQLVNFSAAQSRTNGQTASIGSLNQSSSGTNAAAVLVSALQMVTAYLSNPATPK